MKSKVKEFPVHSGSTRKSNLCPRAIPWELVVECEGQVLRNHCGQSIELLADRGGLGIEELYFAFHGWRWREHPVPSYTEALASVLSSVAHYLRRLHGG